MDLHNNDNYHYLTCHDQVKKVSFEFCFCHLYSNNFT